MVRRIVAALALVAVSAVAVSASGEGIVTNLQGKLGSLQPGQSVTDVGNLLGEPGAFANRRGNLAYSYCETRAQDTIYATVFIVDGLFHSFVIEQRAELITPCDSDFPRVDWDALAQ